MSIEPLRWGILSTARINTKVLTGAGLTAASDIVAIASRDARRADEFARRWSIPRSYGSYDTLLDDEDIEAVYVPLPNALHHPWTMRALEAGKHVLCEKPYSRHPGHVAEAFDLADAHGLVLSEAYMYRYHPQIRRLGSLVADGAIGGLRMINSSFTWPTGHAGDIRLDAELDGGSLLDVGCYCVSAARLLAGEPSAGSADWVIGPTGVEVRIVGALRFDGDVQLHFDSGFHLPNRSLLEVVGAEGYIRVRDPWHGVDAALEITVAGGAPIVETFAGANSYRLELEAFADSVRGRPSSLLGRSDAHGQAAALDALYRAAEAGRTVPLP